ncbi:RNA polymerase II-associated protein 3 [Dissophora globulifera]|uniref:RNA polymerase II-associated protein 3 n=1 Tax=Dissophora globulifera TaxID=979702 RepID=A0A9P6RXA2_9FUNG|nr:RNA polymerase II-associated protein 3 [Dissophora globulifera]
MDTATLDRIAQWEKAHSKGNKKPIAPKEYPPLRPKKDIVLQDVNSVLLTQKTARQDAPVVSSILKDVAEKTIPVAPTPSMDAASPEILQDTSLIRQAENESKVKSEVNQTPKNKVEKTEALRSKSSTETATTPVAKAASAAPAKPKSTNLVTPKASDPVTPKASDPAKPKASDPAAANVEKEKGNEFFKKGDYKKAVEHYTASMTLDPSNSVLPINRAMALLKLERFADAERDCTLGLKLDNKNVKALWRRGIARRSLNRTEEAKADFELALKIDPSNKAVKDELAKLQQQSPSASKAKAPSTTKPKTSTTPTTTATKKPDVSAAKLQNAQTPAAAEASSSASPAVISSKRVLIKEIEDDGESEFFAPTTASSAAKKQSALPATDSQPVTPSALNTSPLPKATPETAQPSTGRPLSIQMTVPMTNMELQRDWKSYSKNTALLYQYIKLIPAEKLPVLFKSAFEPDYLSSILLVYRDYYIPNDDPQVLYNSLLHLSKVQRLDMNLMFMASTDKRELAAIFKSLSSRLGDQTVYNQQDLTALASKFKTVIE